MTNAGERFVHVLLFECPQCGCPVPCAITSDKSNPEEVDARGVSLKCNCRWSGTALGVSAKRRLVVDWQFSTNNLGLTDPSRYHAR
jgi:hypothetical protein